MTIFGYQGFNVSIVLSYVFHCHSVLMVCSNDVIFLALKL